MSNYIFTPSPTFGVSEHPFATWNNGFTDEEIDLIVSYCDSLDLQDGTVSSEESIVPDVRRSKVGWVSNSPIIGWLYDRLANIARSINGEFYKFDLYGFCEDMQYTLYEEDTNGHYDWHRDSGVPSNSSFPPRKLSLVLQLTDPAEYEGGELELYTSRDPSVVAKKKGMVVAFPSYTLHRVTPVTKGKRRTIVVWVTGPAFK